jgi:hypothetical protein
VKAKDEMSEEKENVSALGIRKEDAEGKSRAKLKRV